MMLRTIIQIIILLVAAPLVAAETVVYTAKLIRTMEPALPLASAVAVENGKVLAVGDLESLAHSFAIAVLESIGSSNPLL